MLDLDDLEAQAAARLPEHVMGYFLGPTPPDGIRTDSECWSALRFRPRVLRDTTGLSLTTSVLGTPVASPILVAPMAQQVAADPEGERATARAAARVGSLLGVSTNTGVPFADVAVEGAPWWFQVYVMDDRSITEGLVRRAAAAGASALILTVDLPVVDPRRPHLEPRTWTDRNNMLANLDPGLVARGLENLRGTRALTPDAVGWLGEISGLPVVAKGVLRGDDAARCVAAGAAGVIVSTHGGRRLGQSVAAVDALPEVVAAVAGRAEVYVDSGLRTPEHVAAALCLGANAVFLGRPVLWALASGGAARVVELLTGWNAELAVVLKQLGVTRLDDVGPDLVV
ncbi:MAG: alpha-hydroxy acid oxidase [Propionibacteriaceae bacterium]